MAAGGVECPSGRRAGGAGHAAHPHSVMSERKLEAASICRAWSAVVIGAPFLVLVGFGQRIQVGLDVPLAVEIGQRGERGSISREEAAEVGQPGGQGRDGLGPTGARLAFKIGDEGRPQRRGDVGHAILEGPRRLPVRRRRVEDLQMEHHPVGAVEG